MMDSKPLIVGAGPVGLAAAVFLANRGIPTRIVDAAPRPSITSRALAVNPRTLDLLEPTGVTAKMLERGLKIREVNLHGSKKLLARIPLKDIPHRFPFLLALSQATTEKLLAEALEALGGKVQRGVKLAGCAQKNKIISATLDNGGMLNPLWLLGADGARSTVREQLKLGFDGSSFPESWHLMDVALDWNLAPDAAHIWFFDDGGFIFALRVVEDIREESKTAPLWRILGNSPDLLPRLPQAKPLAPPVWTSEFHISHRLASHLNVGNIYLAGDAAHIHSPMGARGMNLGIEDAWTFAELMKAGRPERYGEIRRRIDASVIRRVKLFTNVARGQSPVTRFLRRNLMPLLPHVKPLYALLTNTADGLDHEVEL